VLNCNANTMRMQEMKCNRIAWNPMPIQCKWKHDGEADIHRNWLISFELHWHAWMPQVPHNGCTSSQQSGRGAGHGWSGQSRLEKGYASASWGLCGGVACLCPAVPHSHRGERCGPKPRNYASGVLESNSKMPKPKCHCPPPPPPPPRTGQGT